MAYIALVPLLCLILPQSIIGIVESFVVYFVIATIVYRKNKKAATNFFRMKYPRLSVSISLIFGGLFFLRWLSSDTVPVVLEMLHLPVKMSLGVLAIGGAISSVFGIDAIISSLIDYSAAYAAKEKTIQKEKMHLVITTREFVFILLVAIITMTVCTESSPLYPFNTWDDSNSFFTVGKSMLGGLVPYQDLFEQKGPLIYFIHAAAAFISYDSFIVIYIFEVISCFLFLLCCYHILRIYFDTNVIFMIPILSTVVYTADCFCHGDSVEEFCLPLLAYGLLVSVKALKQNSLPSNKACFMIGITSACVLWMKFSILGFYIGWIITPAYLAITQKNLFNLCKKIGIIILGVVTVTIPFVIYFGLHGAISDWFEIYFYDNLFAYSVSRNSSPLGNMPFNLCKGLNMFLASNMRSLVFAAAGIIWCVILKDKLVVKHLLCTFVGVFVSSYMGGRHYQYYALSFSVFVIWGIAWIYELLNSMAVENQFNFKCNNMMLALLCTCAVVTFILCPNTYLLRYDRDDIPQFRVKAVISQSGKDNPTLLNYGFLDGGFYTVAAIQPNCKYFQRNNISLEIMMDQQNYYIQNGLVDFIVSQEELTELDLYNYIDSFSYFYYTSFCIGTERTYYLYELKE